MQPGENFVVIWKTENGMWDGGIGRGRLEADTSRGAHEFLNELYRDTDRTTEPSGPESGALSVIAQT